MARDNDNLNKRLTIRLSDWEYQILGELAEWNGKMSKGAYVRYMLAGAYGDFIEDWANELAENSPKGGNHG